MAKVYDKNSQLLLIIYFEINEKNKQDKVQNNPLPTINYKNVSKKRVYGKSLLKQKTVWTLE